MLVLHRHTADAILSFLGLLASFVSCLTSRSVDCHLASGLVASLDIILDIVVLFRRLPTAFVVAPVSVPLATVACMLHQRRHRTFDQMRVLQCAFDDQIVLIQSAIAP